ncbi:MAG: hypothetical protein AB9880_05650 [Christensenellales bacterium]
MAEPMVFLWAATAVGLLLTCWEAKRREKQLMDRLREGSLYPRLYQKMVYLLQHYDIDQLRVEQQGVTVTSVYPAHTLLSFDFKQNGNSKRSDSFPRLVAQLLQDDFPALGSGEIYRLTRYRIYRANGRREFGFSFTMRRRHKDLLISRRSRVQLRIL